MEILLILLILITTSIAIYFVGNIFANASSNIGEYLGLSKSVKGATFDAIASSMPELMVALFGVIFFNKFEFGVGTIIGSALFNLLIIPALCVMVAPIAFRVKNEVVKRDAIFYMFSIFLLLSLIILFKFWGVAIALILIILYVIYLQLLVRDTKRHKGSQDDEVVERSKINLYKEIGIFISSVVVMGIATYFLTEASVNLAEILSVHPIIIAFTVTAAATSVPDAVISVANAKKGDLDDATSNVFGSNIFDIAIGLGLPLLIYTVGFGSVEMVFENIELVLALMGSSIYVLFVLSDDNSLSRKEGYSFLLIYLMILLYVVYLSFY